MPDRLYKMQKFPVYYPGSAAFVDGNSQPSGATGASATIEIGLNNRPHEIVGVRVINVYERLPVPCIPVGVPPTEVGQCPIPLVDVCCLLEMMDGDQDISLSLAQQNVIINPMSQVTLTGKGGVHWHPFPCSYPFRGGNNMQIRIVRTSSYPPEILPTAKVAVLGWMYVSDELPPGSPPSTDFVEPPQGATGY